MRDILRRLLGWKSTPVSITTLMDIQKRDVEAKTHLYRVPAKTHLQREEWQ